MGPHHWRKSTQTLQGNEVSASAPAEARLTNEGVEGKGSWLLATVRPNNEG